MRTSENHLVTLVRSAALIRKFSLSNVLAPPIGLAYLGGALTRNQIKYEIIDATGESLDQVTKLKIMDAYAVGLTNDEIVQRINPSTDIVGVSCMFSSSWNHDLDLLKKIKSALPNVIIILGGEHSTACYDYILTNHSEVDFCVLGEGEETIIELIHGIRNSSALSGIPGIAYFKDNTIVKTPKRKRITQIDNIALPEWDKTPINNYLQKRIGHGVVIHKSMPLLGTRGCPYECTFCSSPEMWTTTWVARSPKLVVDEIESYIQKYGATNFDFFDLTAIIQKKWIIDFCKEINARNLKITFQLPSGTRSEAIDSEVAFWLKKSGCLQLNYAPETGSPKTLQEVKKKINLTKLEQSMKEVISQDIKVMCNIILFPEESLLDVLKTFKFMFKASWLGLHDITFIPFVPYPGTEMYQSMLKRKLIPSLSEDYFNSLLIHSDLSKANSYNKNFSPRMTILLKLVFLSSFYISNYLIRPIRFFKMVRNLYRRTPETRGEDGLLILLRKLKKI